MPQRPDQLFSREISRTGPPGKRMLFLQSAAAHALRLAERSPGEIGHTCQLSRKPIGGVFV